MKPVMVLYVPVLHRGYIELFKKYSTKVDQLFLLGRSLTKELTFLEQEIRAIDPSLLKKLIEALGYFREVLVLTHGRMASLPRREIITINEQISIRLMTRYFPRSSVTYDSCFLRWDEANIFSLKPIVAERSSRGSDKKIMAFLSEESRHSSDWWRQVGAAIVKDGKIILKAHNVHLPSEHTPYVYGDPRDHLKPGEKSEICSAIHAEQKVIAEAAKNGVKLDGVSIYVTTFPCPLCAKLIYQAGIKKCYFLHGHSSLNSQELLAGREVGIIQVI